MEHRQKRVRLDDAEGSLESLAASASIATSSAAPDTAPDTAPDITSDAAPETAEDTSTLSPEPARIPDKSTWQGWAEIENDPLIFNVMLREWGVRGIQVNEVVPLDAIFDSSPASTFGLIFLCRYCTSKKERIAIDIPQGLWFANQTSTYSCATVALMNILSNLENVNLGPEMSQFINATRPMSSKDKGLALDSFEHVKKAHNSFATLIDMKCVDRRLRNDARTAAHKKAQAAKKAAASASQTNASKKGKKKKKKSRHHHHHHHPPSNASSSDTDSTSSSPTTSTTGFHFTAYTPAHNHLWRLDGLQRHPESLATLSSPSPSSSPSSLSPSSHEKPSSSDGTTTTTITTKNWLDMAVAELSAQWQSAAEHNLEFSLLSLVAAPAEAEVAGGGNGEEEDEEYEDQLAGERLKEDWGPALEWVVRGVAEGGGGGVVGGAWG